MGSMVRILYYSEYSRTNGKTLDLERKDISYFSMANKLGNWVDINLLFSVLVRAGGKCGVT